MDKEINNKTLVVAIGSMLIPLYNTYPKLHKINVGRHIIEIYMFNNNEDSELCFVIAGTEDNDRYDCNLFLDSDLCSSPSYFDSYDDILSDIAHMIYAVDDSYNKHHIDIETFIKYSDTAESIVENRLSSKTNNYKLDIKLFLWYHYRIKSFLIQIR